MDMRDIEQAIREAEAAGDLPPMPDEPSPVEGSFGGDPQDALPAESNEAQVGESLTVNFDQPSFDQPVSKDDEVVALLRDLVEICRRGFGY